MSYTPGSQLLRLPEVLRRTGMSRSWIYKAIACGAFPKHHKIGRASAWHAAEVDAWINACLNGSAGVDGGRQS